MTRALAQRRRVRSLQRRTKAPPPALSRTCTPSSSVHEALLCIARTPVTAVVGRATPLARRQPRSAPAPSTDGRTVLGGRRQEAQGLGVILPGADALCVGRRSIVQAMASEGE